MSDDEIAQWKALAKEAAQCGEWRAFHAIRNDKVQLPAKISAFYAAPDGEWRDTPIATCDWMPHKQRSNAHAEYIAHSSPERVLALLEAMDRLRAATTWQPMETAPKDGTRVVLLSTYGYADVGWYERHNSHDISPVWVNCSLPVAWAPLPKEQP